MRKIIYKTHKWLGLVAGIPMLLISVTGSILLFRPQLERLTMPAQFRLAESGHALPIAELLQRAGMARPGTDITGYGFPESPERPAIVTFHRGEAFTTAFINPRNARLLLEDTPQQSIFAALYAMHTTLFLSRTGGAFVALIGLSLALLALTGFYVYKGALRHLFRLRRRRHIAISLADIHRLVGMWTLVMLCMWGVTGFWMNKENLLPAAKGGTAKHWLPPLPLESYVNAANRVLPGWSPTYLSLPEQGASTLTLWGAEPARGTSAVYGNFAVRIDMDASTAAVKQIAMPSTSGAAMKWDRLNYPVHTAYFAGASGANLPLKFFYAACGISPSVLSITGFALWWMRHRKPRYSKALIYASAADTG